MEHQVAVARLRLKVTLFHAPVIKFTLFHAHKIPAFLISLTFANLIGQIRAMHKELSIETNACFKCSFCCDSHNKSVNTLKLTSFLTLGIARFSAFFIPSVVSSRRDVCYISKKKLEFDFSQQLN